MYILDIINEKKLLVECKAMNVNDVLLNLIFLFIHQAICSYDT